MTRVLPFIATCTASTNCNIPTGLPALRTTLRVVKGGSCSHFPAQILTKSQCPRAQIRLSGCPAQILIPFPFSIVFLPDESQSQCLKSHFNSQK